ncbi:MAG: Uma2 family endonuclease [Clostridiales bacterium]|jgi:Uma2 family endonuclease|nr:Uma2 family endonuclease [Clostridiales bacterium]
MSLASERLDYEVINGQVYMMAQPTMNHIAIAGNINWIFKNFLRDKTCKTYSEPDVFLDEQNNFVPDVVILCDRSKRTLKGIYGAPDLVVEILSKSTAKRDMEEKKGIYEKYGVKEYWLVNPFSMEITVYHSRDGLFRIDNIYSYVPAEKFEQFPDEEKRAVMTRFKTSLFEDLEIKVADVFDDVE